jgi:hypothetical protein
LNVAHHTFRQAEVQGKWLHEIGGIIVKQERRDDAQLRKKIMLIIDHELSKQNPDMKMIEAFSAVLNEMEHGAQPLDPKEREEAIKNLKQACHKIMEKKTIDSAKPMRGRRMVRKTVAVLCTILVVFGLMLGTVCAIGGVSPITVLENIGHAIFGWEVGEPVEIEGLTFIRNGEPKQYDNIEQCLQEEGLDICYPTWLPEGVNVESILMLSTGTNDTIIYEMNSDIVYLSINTQEQIEDILKMHYSEINTDGICIYYNLDENIYRAKVEISNIIYSISSYDLEIIKNMALGLIG